MGRHGRQAWRAALLLPAVAVLAAGIVGAGGPGTAAATPAGPSWTATLAPLPSGATTGVDAFATIKGSTCPSPGFCVAVGRYNSSAGLHTQAPVVELYAAGAWTPITVPMPSGAAPAATQVAILTAVACAGPTSCVAVGYYTVPGGQQLGLIEALSGSTWTATSAPEPPGAGSGTHQHGELDTVSCPAPGSCVAGGNYGLGAGGWAPLAVAQSNGGWAAPPVTLPATALTDTQATGTMTSVSCWAVGSCVGTGLYNTALHSYHGLIATLSGGSWATAASPLPANHGTAPTETEAELVHVTCPAPGSCVAVGTYATTTRTSLGLVVTLAGGTWTAAEAPLPSGTSHDTTVALSNLNSVSCPAVGTCTAVGTYLNATSHEVGLIDTLSGGSWSPAPAPQPADSATLYARLSTVSCQAPGACVTVGHYENRTHKILPMSALLSAGTWVSMGTPLPGGAATTQTSTLRSVSCSGGGCVAVGVYTIQGGGEGGLLETYNLAPSGYFEAASDGGIFAFTVPFHGSEGGKPLNAPIVYAVADPITGGYYEVASDGGIFAFTAPFHGSMGGKPLNEPIVGMAFDTRTGGYYLVASDGGLFAFTAPFHGSMGGKPLNKPIVGMAFDPTTGGYWEVASDGGLFAFTAPFHGSMGGKPLNEPIVGMTFDTLTGGYYEVATDGGLFAFTAPFEGSMGGKPLNEPVVGMAFDYGTGGYWEVASDGGLFSFQAPFLGSMGGKPLNEPIVTMALG